MPIGSQTRLEWNLAVQATKHHANLAVRRPPPCPYYAFEWLKNATAGGKVLSRDLWLIAGCTFSIHCSTSANTASFCACFNFSFGNKLATVLTILVDQPPHSLLPLRAVHAALYSTCGSSPPRLGRSCTRMARLPHAIANRGAILQEALKDMKMTVAYDSESQWLRRR